MNVVELELIDSDVELRVLEGVVVGDDVEDEVDDTVKLSEDDVDSVVLEEVDGVVCVVIEELCDCVVLEVEIDDIEDGLVVD